MVHCYLGLRAVYQLILYLVGRFTDDPVPGARSIWPLRPQRMENQSLATVKAGYEDDFAG